MSLLYKMQKNKIVFLIRAYNEATRISSVIEGIFHAWFTEILVIDDGSIDDTAILLESLIRESKIHYVRHITNRGAWAALETGFSFIRSNAEWHNWKYLVTFDADWQHDIRDMERFLTAFKKDESLDVVLGSRFIEKTKSNVPFLRKITLFWGRVFTSLVSWVHLTDAHNGYRMFRVETLNSIHITMDGMEYASELIDQIGKNKFKFIEVPVNIHYDSYSLGKWQRYGGIMRIVLRMLYKKLF